MLPSCFCWPRASLRPIRAAPTRTVATVTIRTGPITATDRLHPTQPASAGFIVYPLSTVRRRNSRHHRRVEVTGQCHLCRADALGNQSSGPRAESQSVDGIALKRCLKGTEIFLLVLSLVLFRSSHQLSSIHAGCGRCWGSTRRPSYCFTQSHTDSKPASFTGERVFSCLTLTLVGGTASRDISGTHELRSHFFSGVMQLVA